MWFLIKKESVIRALVIQKLLLWLIQKLLLWYHFHTTKDVSRFRSVRRLTSVSTAVCYERKGLDVVVAPSVI